MRGHGRWATGGRGLELALACLIAAGCEQLAFLAPPSVPRPKGESWLTRGPAYEGAVDGEARPLPALPDPAGDWGAYNNTLTGERWSPLAQITTANVARLRRVCTFRLGERASMQSGPVVVAGTMYVTTAQSTYAIDAATCELRWHHRYRYTPGPPYDLKVNRGVAYLDGRLFRGANDGRVYALDAATGRELWSAVVGDPRRGETFPAAPVAWRGLVFIGNAGGDNFGVTGRMMALDTRTGARVWSFDLVPAHGAANRSWPEATEVVPKGGGASWTSYAIDTVAGIVYVPTGNPGPDFLIEVRRGRNLYTNSVVGLAAASGELREWHQLLPLDWHDWDVAAAPMLVTTASGRRLLVAAGKDGYLHAIDRAGGATAFRTPVTRIENAEAPLTHEGTRFCPGANGGVEWNGPTYSPRANAFFVNAVEWCTTLRLGGRDELKGKDGLPWTGSRELRHPFGRNDRDRRGWLTAVDAEDGRPRWRYASPTPLVAGVTATAGGVLFTGDLRGAVLALDASDGRVLWRGDTGQPIGGGVISYSVRGRQYIAVASGLHAPVTWQLRSSPATVVLFALP